jgi:thymidylate kinase
MGAFAADVVATDQPAPRFIYITGCDGTGKTTQSRLLIEQLQRQGIKVRHVWLRFPFLFSAPLLAFARWRGYSWSEVHGQVRHGYWDFRRSWLMRTVFPWILWLDAAIAAIWKIHIPLWFGDTIVCERFVLDMLVDLAVAYEEPLFFSRLPGKWYMNLLPGRTHVVILDLDAETIRLRRLDLMSDHQLDRRLQTFMQLCQVGQLPVLSSRTDIQVLNQSIRKLLGYVD